MTAAQALARTDALYPTAVDTPDRLRWLAALDCRAALDLARLRNPNAAPAYRILAPDDTLSIPAPHDEAYLHYLAAKCAFTEGDIARYHEQSALYEAAYADYLSTLRRANPPAHGTFLF